MKIGLLLVLSTMGAPSAWAQKAPGTPSPAASVAAEADRLFVQRGDPAKLHAAMRLWETQLEADPKAYDAAWHLAHAHYFEGGHEAERGKRMELYLQGVRFAERAAALRPDRPEGHFWLAVLNGVYARDKGVFKSLTMIRPIRQGFERAFKIDPSYERGGPDRALGRFYFELPGILGGSKQTSLDHLQASLKYAPQNTLTLLYLGETLAGMGRKDEARKAYQSVLDAPVDPLWATEDGDNMAAAGKALGKR